MYVLQEHARTLPETVASGKVPAGADLAADAVRSARAAGLRWVTDSMPGIRRRRRGKGFFYLGIDGSPVRDREERRRIEALAVPPAWTEVWICTLTNGHLQATGRDARGRKQYRYHPDWRAVRDETKFGRMVAFGEALPRLRARIEKDLEGAGLRREKVLAAVVRLLDTTLLRVGNEEYARQNGSFGLTTLRNRHVAIDGATVRFKFRGKSGKDLQVAVADRRLARVVRACRELPGQELFQYLDAAGEAQPVDSADVNEYLRAATGEDFTAKDFRTWGGTVLAIWALLATGAAASPRAGKRRVVEAIARVAEQLGNRPAVCRKYYVHPAVIEAFLSGQLGAAAQAVTDRAAELAALAEDGRPLTRTPPPWGVSDFEELALELIRGLPPAERPKARRAGKVRRKKRRPGTGRSAQGNLEL